MLPELRLYHYKARAYDPVIGRFLQTDPVGYEAGDMNLYAYVGNDPLNSLDPSGEIRLLIRGLKAGRELVRTGGDYRRVLRGEFADIVESGATLLDGRLDVNDAIAVVELATGLEVV